jgi:acetolactate synthase-1/3 small subunit
MQHTLVAIVENKPGVLNRVASLFRRRNFNIASLTVGETDDPAISRMTIVVDTKTTKPHIVTENLYKLVNVIEVQDITGSPSVQRDLALIKVRADATCRAEVMQFSELYRVKIVHVARDSLILEMTGTPDEVDAFVEIMRPFGILEMVRTGAVAMESGTNGRALPASNGHANGHANGHKSHYIQPLADREGV